MAKQWLGTGQMHADHNYGLGTSCRPTDCAGPAHRPIWLNQHKMLKNDAGGGFALMKEGREKLDEAV
jgi:hypothetical protein